MNTRGLQASACYYDKPIPSLFLLMKETSVDNFRLTWGFKGLSM